MPEITKLKKPPVERAIANCLRHDTDDPAVFVVVER